MSELLPILHPAMSLCGICPDPGHCCQSFQLIAPSPETTGERSFWESSWREDALAFAQNELGLPFEPSAIAERFAHDPEPYVTVLYSCPKLQADGLCGIYEDRPNLCRRYVPGSDSICAMKGIVSTPYHGDSTSEVAKD
jgi:Fe-S-cluster containining protein